MSKKASLFQTGGALPVSSKSYILRSTDREALIATEAVEYIHVIAPRQMGKTSLLKRVSSELSKHDWRCSYVDLSILKSISDESRWYTKFGKLISKTLTPKLQIHIEDAVDLQEYLIEAALYDNEPRKIALFLDEVGAMSKHIVSDGFFSTLRYLYNIKEDYQGDIVICFSGTFNPDQLVQDDTISPFNIGTRIPLVEFTKTETLNLTMLLNQLNSEIGEKVHERIYEWTSGQPYLTQIICHKLEQQITKDYGLKAHRFDCG